MIPPKHGSWLNIAEIELQVLSGQCLDRRIDNRAELGCEVQAWTDERNASIIGVDWQFTTKDARTKLKRLYPEFQALPRQRAGSPAKILSRP